LAQEVSEVYLFYSNMPCSVCAEEGHDKRNCPLLRMDDSAKRPAAGSPVKEKMNELKKVRSRLEEGTQSGGASSTTESASQLMVLDAVVKA